MIFQYDCEPVLIHRILIGLEAILEYTYLFVHAADTQILTRLKLPVFSNIHI